MKCLRLLAFLPVIFGLSCASSNKKLEVSVFHLNDLDLVDKANRVVRAEKQKRLRGAVEYKDRLARRGLYYTAEWDLSEQVVSQPIRIVFRYHQAATASKELRMVQNFDATKTRGSCEFVVAGESYQKSGRVLSWRTELYAGKQLLASDQSYMWE